MCSICRKWKSGTLTAYQAQGALNWDVFMTDTSLLSDTELEHLMALYDELVAAVAQDGQQDADQEAA